MISDVERYQGIVLRQVVMACPEGVRVRPVNRAGRADAYSLGNAAFLVKHSSKRLSPWRFTLQPEHMQEFAELGDIYAPVWLVLVCGIDGLVAISMPELHDMVGLNLSAAGWLRVSRGRNEMYRVAGPLKELERAKPRGVEIFVNDARAAGAVEA